jgi:hypothetical protein
LRWNPQRIETESEKQAHWKKEAEEMRDEWEADRAQDTADKMVRLQRKKDLARERQRRHREKVKQQNPRSGKKGKNVNDVSECTLTSHSVD